MVKLIGINKINIAVFISGKGSNLKSLIEYSKNKKSTFKVDLVLSDKKAPGLKYAKRYNIDFSIINYSKKYKAEKFALKLLKKKKINLICFAGFMRIISNKFLKEFNGKILNIHPSLLPKYKGLNTHEKVIKNKENYSGCTVHLVNSRLDSGKIIMQKKVKVFRNDTPVSLKKRILQYEHKLYPKAISKFIANF